MTTIPIELAGAVVSGVVLIAGGIVKALWAKNEKLIEDLKTEIKAQAKTLPQVRVALEEQVGIPSVRPPALDAPPRGKMSTHRSIELVGEERRLLDAALIEYGRKMVGEELERERNRGRGRLEPWDLTPRVTKEGRALSRRYTPAGGQLRPVEDAEFDDRPTDPPATVSPLPPPPKRGR